MELSFVQMVMVVVIVLIICATWLIGKFIVVSNETKISLKRIEVEGAKPEPEIEAVPQMVLQDTNPVYNAQQFMTPGPVVSLSQDPDPTVCFPRVEVAKNYIADYEPGSTVIMPKVESEDEQKLEEE